MQHVLISLGSNVGDRLVYLRKALKEISRIDRTRVRAVSSVYETEPVGVKEQPDFLNAAAELESDLDPVSLFRELKKVERRIGRTQAKRWGPREIDIDIIYFGRDRVEEGGLLIPHPEVTNRKFVLVPLSEIIGTFRDPLRNCSVDELLAACKDRSRIEKTSYLLSPETQEL